MVSHTITVALQIVFLFITQDVCQTPSQLCYKLLLQELFVYGLADCPDGYEGHLDFCYKLLPVKASWGSATRYCEAEGGSLAVIQNDLENNFVKGLMARNHEVFQRYCESEGGSLAVIRDDLENNFVKGLMARNHAIITTPLVWIGGSDLLQEGTWLAPNTLQPLTYFHWAPGDPDNLKGQHCLAIFNNGPNYLWDDGSCETLNLSLCKRPRTVGSSSIIG